jgi:hypothetical protein
MMPQHLTENGVSGYAMGYEVARALVVFDLGVIHLETKEAGLEQSGGRKTDTIDIASL